jgi:hypothetical protein
MTLKHVPVTSRGKSAPGPDPRIRHRIQTNPRRGLIRGSGIDSRTPCAVVRVRLGRITIGGGMFALLVLKDVSLGGVDPLIKPLIT